jgi:hypothetical protein
MTPAPVEPRSIDELVTLYQLEPGLRDVFVEGPSDKALIRWYLSRKTLRDVSVFTIDAVYVPSTLVPSDETNAKKRVIALALQLAERIGESSRSATCIVDSDFDPFLAGSLPKVGLLLPTDFSSLDAYLYDEEVFAKFLDLYVWNTDMTAGALMAELTPTLARLFLIRMCKELLDLDLPYLTFERCCSISGSRVVFDESDYLTRYSRSVARKEMLERCVNEHAGRLTGDARSHINAHDLFALLRWYLRPNTNNRAILAEGAMERALYACLEPANLDPYPFFSQLVRRLSE